MIINKKKSPLSDRLSGSFKDVIIYKHRNQTCIRKKPLKMKSPSLLEQLAQQNRIASVAIFYRSLKKAGIYPYWRQAAAEMVMNGYNLLVKNNLPAFNGNGRICDFSKLRLTVGPVTLPDELQLHESGEGRWRMEWKNTFLQVNALSDDRLILCVMKDRETFEVKMLDVGTVCRCDGTLTFDLTGELKEYPHLYVVFCSHTGEKCSESRYFNIHLKN